MKLRAEAYRVLVVDDDAGMRLGMFETLRRRKYQVDQADSAEAGLAMVKKHCYQALITDMRMPGMSGIELLREVKKISPATEVILVTAYGTVATAVEAMKIGAFNYILKPFGFSDLEKMVEDALVKNMPKTSYRTQEKRFEIVTKSPKMLQILDMARRAAQSTATVLIQAESGTGKELFARFICANSPRADKPVVAINCAALPDNLLESELFGYEKGSFTGALHSKPGKFELANEGTILLDEIGEMPLGLQSKLLRVLQEQEVDRIGGRQPIKIDVRVIAMTNRNLKKQVEDGNFREDLYFRLNVIPIEIPKLAERPEDLGPLCDHFIQKYGEGQSATIAPSAMRLLQNYSWPGNVREMENMIQRALILSGRPVLEARDLFLFQDEMPVSSAASDEGARQGGDGSVGGIRLEAGATVQEMERRLIEITLAETDNNKTHAAKMLGISLRTLRNKLNEYASE